MQRLPVYIDGKECGSLKIYSDGLMRVFDAKCHAAAQSPLRLYLYGGGASALLGTLWPNGTGLGIVRRFSRTELRGLPESIEYAADRPLPLSENGDTLWRRGKMGCLLSDGLIAIPADGTELCRVSDKLRSIEGKTYLIFERKL